MGCCGQKRAALRSAPTPVTTPAGTQPSPSRPLANVGQRTSASTESISSSVTLRYLESSPILVRGPATGRQYQFSGTRPVQPVDARDAEALLRTRFFRRNS